MPTPTIPPRRFYPATFVFVLRVWHEPHEIENVEGEWRCMVQNVDTGEVAYFLNPAILAEYLRRVTGETNAANKSD